MAGAAEGLGAAWVDRLLADGMTTVVAVDLRAEGLAALTTRHPGRIVAVEADLGDAGTWDALEEAVVAHRPRLVVVNAALSPDERFVRQPLDTKLATLEVNAAAPLRLLDLTLPAMEEAGAGAVVLTSSLSALAANPRLAMYAATKAYLLSLAMSLNVELAPLGIDVLALQPGQVATPGFLTSRHGRGRAGERAMAPEAVVDAAVHGLGRRPLVIPGRGNQAGALLLGRLLPRRTANRLMATVLERSAPPD